MPVGCGVLSDLVTRLLQQLGIALAVTLQPTREGVPTTPLISERRQYVDSRGAPTFEPVTEVGILESLRQDVYLVLVGVPDEQTAEVRISFNPLVWWVWFGGLIMAFGGLIVMWPQSTRRRAHGGYVTSLEPGVDGVPVAVTP